MKKITLIILLLILFPNPAFAQNKVDQTIDQSIQSVLSVSPVIINTTLVKGQENIYEIRVKNLLDQPLGIRTSLEDFTAADEENALSFSTRSRILDFSALSQESFIIDPKETKTFNLKLNTPSDLKDGGYYEVIFLTPFYTRSLSPNETTVLSKIGILVLGNAGTINFKDIDSKVKILELTPEGNANDLSALFRVENDYFNHFSAKPFLTLTPLFGKSEKFILPDKNILPGKIRKWDEKINIKRKSLFYKATLAVSAGQGHFVYKDSYFLLFPVKKALLGIVLLLFVSLILLRKKQVSKAIKVIIKG